MAMKFNKNFDIGRVVKRLVYTILSLYVGGSIVSTFGTVMNCTYSPFFTGLSLIGWTTTNVVNLSASAACGSLYPVATHNGQAASGLVTSVSGTGVLSVIGVIAIASVVMEFISF